MNDFVAPAPSKGMPSWSDGVTLSYGGDGVRLTRHRSSIADATEEKIVLKTLSLWRGRDSEVPINEPRCM